MKKVLTSRPSGRLPVAAYLGSLANMGPTTKYVRIRLLASTAAFLLSSIFTGYLAWTEKRPQHELLDSFSLGFSRVPFGWVQPTFLVGLGLFFLYISVELPTPSRPQIVVKTLRWFRKSIFFRFLPFAVFFALFSGFLLGPGITYLTQGDTPRAYAFIAYGIYCGVVSLLFVMLPSMAVFFVRRFKKRELLEAVCRL